MDSAFDEYAARDALEKSTRRGQPTWPAALDRVYRDRRDKDAEVLLDELQTLVGSLFERDILMGWAGTIAAGQPVRRRSA